VTLERIETTAELHRAVAAELPGADVLIMAAAPADYRPAEYLDRKRPRASGARDARAVSHRRRPVATRDRRKPGAIMVGFALETGRPWPRPGTS
jgi:phosphopantothenoylcysteine decarboxylase/phosphopantothenate--cysteine ligase